MSSPWVWSANKHSVTKSTAKPPGCSVLAAETASSKCFNGTEWAPSPGARGSVGRIGFFDPDGADDDSCVTVTEARPHLPPAHGRVLRPAAQGCAVDGMLLHGG